MSLYKSELVKVEEEMKTLSDEIKELKKDLPDLRKKEQRFWQLKGIRVHLQEILKIEGGGDGRETE